MQKKRRKKLIKIKPNNKVMTLAKNRTLIFCLFIFTCFSSCDYVKYTKAVKEDTKKRIITSKEFMQRISFNASVLEKDTTEESSDNFKYSLKLHIYNMSEEPNISTQFPPYYTFEKDTTLLLLVTKEIYNNVKIESKLIKQGNSLNIIVDNQKFQYLSDKKDKWLP